MTRRLLFLCLLFALLGGCSKPDPDPGENGDPVFYLESNRGNWVAGDSLVYMFTDTASTVEDLLLTGAFSREDCPTYDCSQSVVFQIITKKSFPFSLDSLLKPGILPFQPVVSLRYSGAFAATGLDLLTGVQWEFGDGSSASGVDAQHVYETPDVRQVLMTVTLPSGLTVGYEKRVFPDMSDTCFDVPVEIFLDFDSTSFMLQATPPGNPSQFSFQWSNGDTASMTEVLKGVNALSVAVSDLDGRCPTTISLSNFNSLAGQSGTVTTPTFEVQFQKILTVGQPFVQITYYVDGARFSTGLGVQGSGTHFTILQSEPYLPNLQGISTNKLRVQFDCTLYSDVGQALPFTGAGVLAIGVPD